MGRGKEGEGEKGMGNEEKLRMFNALWVGRPTGNKLVNWCTNSGGWKRDEEEFKYLLE